MHPGSQRALAAADRRIRQERPMKFTDPRPLAIVTGASSGIGLELAKICSENYYDLAIAADEPEIEDAAHDLRNMGSNVVCAQVDLSTKEGVDSFLEAIGDRPV